MAVSANGSRHATVNGPDSPRSRAERSMRRRTLRVPIGPQYSTLSSAQQGMMHSLLRQLEWQLADGETPETISWQEGSPILTALKNARTDKAYGRQYSMPRGVVAAPPKSGRTAERRPVVRGEFPEVPQGYYALPSRTGNNDLDFWFVKRYKSGKTGLRRVIGGHSHTPVHGSQLYAVCKAIVEAGVKEAGELYATEMQRCWKCNTHLTEYASRQIKMGSTCAAANGLGELWHELDRKYKSGETKLRRKDASSGTPGWHLATGEVEPRLLYDSAEEWIADVLDEYPGAQLEDVRPEMAKL
jgi:hypothetical protein